MYTAKHAILYKHKVHDGKAIVFYMDVRAPGKGYDEFVRRAAEAADPVTGNSSVRSTLPLILQDMSMLLMVPITGSRNSAPMEPL
jgi:heterodisulfide reductase subunit A-like polyferredoxin